MQTSRDAHSQTSVTNVTPRSGHARPPLLPSTQFKLHNAQQVAGVAGTHVRGRVCNKGSNQGSRGAQGRGEIQGNRGAQGIGGAQCKGGA